MKHAETLLTQKNIEVDITFDQSTKEFVYSAPAVGTVRHKNLDEAKRLFEELLRHTEDFE